jgi:hypothetical protein
VSRTNVDVIAELLRRFRYGLTRPLWHDLSPDLKLMWLRDAELFIAKAEPKGFPLK